MLELGTYILEHGLLDRVRQRSDSEYVVATLCARYAVAAGHLPPNPLASVRWQLQLGDPDVVRQQDLMRADAVAVALYQTIARLQQEQAQQRGHLPSAGVQRTVAGGGSSGQAGLCGTAA
ncbi:hypothetical protein Agub_g9074, partial [Astrephomene gubernaculifera]